MKTEVKIQSGSVNEELMSKKLFFQYSKLKDQMPNKELARRTLWSGANEETTEEEVPEWFHDLPEKA